MILLIERKEFRMNNNIVDFMSKVEIINKDFARYKDEEKGIIFSLNTVQLLPRLDYLELDKTQYETQKFEQKIDNLEYNIINIDKPASKYARTKKEEDKFIIENQKVAVRQVWKVVNALGLYKCFNNKEEAIKVYNELYERVSKNL
jgi:hypothetical protein